MAITYKKHSQSQEENKKSHKYTLNSNTNPSCNSICNIDNYENYDSIQDDRNLLFSKKNRTDIPIDTVIIPWKEKACDITYSNPGVSNSYRGIYKVYKNLTSGKKKSTLFIRLLAVLSKSKNSSRESMAEYLGISVGYFSRLTTELADMGIITKRNITMTDGKQFRNEFTEFGFKYLRKIISYGKTNLPSIQAKFKRIVKGLGLDNLLELIETIKKVKEEKVLFIKQIINYKEHFFSFNTDIQSPPNWWTIPD